MSRLEALKQNWPLYVRVGFGIAVLFAMVGNCTDHREASVIMFIIVAVMWANLRIVEEAIVAAGDLMRKKLSDGDQPPDPPAAG